MLTATIVDPTGVSANIEAIMPNAAHSTDKIHEHIVTERKLLNTRIADNAGNITNAEIRSVPTKLMANTIIIAITTAKIIL